MRPGLAKVFIAIIACAATGLQCAAAETKDTFDFDLPSRPLDEALLRLAEVTGWSIMFRGDEFAGKLSPQIRGRLTREQALRRLLAGTGVSYRIHPRGFISLYPGRTAVELPFAKRNAKAKAVVPEVIIVASRGVLPRTPSVPEPQARVVISREQIDQSSASTVGDFLRTALPASGTSSIPSGPVALGPRSFRFASSPRVLIEGAAYAPAYAGGASQSPHLASIPLEAVDRIEVLSGTSLFRSGGGGSEVMNIVLRRDGPGTRLGLTYGGTSAAPSNERGVFLSQVMEAEGGNTRLDLSGSFSTAAGLHQDNAFLERGRKRIASNNPDFYRHAAPPLGASTNLRTLDGAPLAPGTPAFARMPWGYSPGDERAALLRDVGSYDLDLVGSAQEAGGRDSTWEGSSNGYLSAQTAHHFSPRVSGYLQASASRLSTIERVSIADYAGVTNALIRADAPTNPFGRDLLVSIPAAGSDTLLHDRVNTEHMSASVRLDLSEAWAFSAEHSTTASEWRWQEPIVRSAAEDIASGRIDPLRDLRGDPLELSSFLQGTRTLRITSRAQETTLRLNGEPSTRRGTRVPVWARLQHHVETISGANAGVFDRSFPNVRMSLPREDRSVDSVGGGIRVPLHLDAGLPAEGLGLDLGARVDRYSRGQPFQALQWIAGLSYSPSRNWSLAGSFSAGSEPPPLADLSDPVDRIIPFGELHDPQRGGEPTASLVLRTGGNRDLRPESWRRWSIGMRMRSASERLFVSFSHTHLARRRPVLAPLDFFLNDPASFEHLFPSRVQRAPATAEDPDEVGRITAIDVSSTNIGRLRTSTLDTDLQWAETLGFGHLSLTATLSWQPRFELQPLPSSSTQDWAGMALTQRPQLYANTSIRLTQGAWMVGWNSRFIDSYRVSRDDAVIRNQGSGFVSAQMFHDLSVSYHIRSPDAHLRFDARNILKEPPAFDAGGDAYASRYGYAESPAYQVSLRMRF